jgi:hypothetical protein
MRRENGCTAKYGSTSVCSLWIGCRQRRLTGFACLVAVSPSTPSMMKRSCQRRTTGFALPDRRMISAEPQPPAVARMILARQNMLLRRVAIADNCLKLTAIVRCAVDAFRSHNESFNCFE